MLQTSASATWTRRYTALLLIPDICIRQHTSAYVSMRMLAGMYSSAVKGTRFQKPRYTRFTCFTGTKYTNADAKEDAQWGPWGPLKETNAPLESAPAYVISSLALLPPPAQTQVVHPPYEVSRKALERRYEGSTRHSSRRLFRHRRYPLYEGSMKALGRL